MKLNHPIYFRFLIVSLVLFIVLLSSCATKKTTEPPADNDEIIDLNTGGDDDFDEIKGLITIKLSADEIKAVNKELRRFTRANAPHFSTSLDNIEFRQMDELERLDYVCSFHYDNKAIVAESKHFKNKEKIYGNKGYVVKLTDLDELFKNMFGRSIILDDLYDLLFETFENTGNAKNADALDKLLDQNYLACVISPQGNGDEYRFDTLVYDGNTKTYRMTIKHFNKDKKPDGTFLFEYSGVLGDYSFINSKFIAFDLID